MTNNDQLLNQIGNLIDQKLEPVKKDLQSVKQTQAETNTTVEQIRTSVNALGAGQTEIKETIATKADVLNVGVKIDKMRKRIEGIEEHTGSPASHKN